MHMQFSNNLSSKMNKRTTVFGVLYMCISLIGIAQQQVDSTTVEQLSEIVVTDSIPLADDAQKCKKIRQLSIAELLAETMRRISNEESVSSLFMD